MDNNFKILVVDDSPTQVLHLKHLLEGEGYKVDTATNGNEALDILMDEYYPVVITDLIMPEMGGLELCDAIRKLEHDGYIYVIIHTVKEESEDIITGLKAGADDYLTKPVNGPELIARLNAARRITEQDQTLREKNRRIEYLANIDSLTETHNRRHIEKHLVSELNRSLRYLNPLSILICDIDYFKRVNDKYGHQAGDCVLKVFAGILKEFIRDDVDWVARYGGEEFLVVLPQTDYERACKAAERYRSAISEKTIDYESNAIMITASFGVASIHPTEKSENINVESLIRAADDCLYKAKEEGRNKVIGKALQ